MIGFFDSGSGGLTVLKACAQALPNEAIFYLGDHARAPYGHRDNKEILAFTAQAVAFLFDQGCHLVILPCNTAAAVALRTLQQNWLPYVAPDNRILGILVPTVEALSGLPWHQEQGELDPNADEHLVAVFATPKTVAAGAYVEEIVKRAPHSRVVQVACPGLVSAIEAHAGESHIDALVSAAIEQMSEQTQGRSPDAVLLGCTHFPLVASVFKRHLPPHVKLISQSEIMADSLVDYLHRHPRFCEHDRAARGVTFATSGDPAHVAQTASNLAGLDAVFRQVDLTPYASTSTSASLGAGTAPPSRAAK